MKQRLFVDMDGTLAEFHPVQSMEELHAEGYFAGLPPQRNVVEAVRILNEDPNIDVYILSAVLSDSKYALKEKTEWLEKYLPEIDSGHYLFPHCGRNKAAVIPNGIRRGDVLIDDFTKNLLAWPEDGIGVKLLNGINHSKGTWKGSRISMTERPADIASSIRKIMAGEIIRQPAPLPPDPRRILCLDVETTGLDENGTREPRWRTVVSMRILLNVSWEELLGCSLEKEDLNVTGRGIESITDPDELIRIVTNSIKELAKCNR